MNVQHKSLVREIDNKMYVGRDQWIQRKKYFWESKKKEQEKRKKDFRSKIKIHTEVVETDCFNTTVLFFLFRAM